MPNPPPPPSPSAPGGATAPHRPRRRVLRWVLLALAVLILLPVGAIAVFVATFDAEAWKPRLESAVEAATGRALTLGGPIAVKPALIPTVTLEDVALANAPGGSRPQMLTVRRVEVRLALLPLLSRRIEVRRLVLVEPDLLLETDAQGRPNWVFAPPAAATPEPTAPPTEAAREASARLGIVVDALRVDRGRVTHRDGQSGATRTVGIPSLEASVPADGPMRLAATVVHEGLPIDLRAETGPLAGLTSPDQPFPIRATATAEGLRLAAEGALARPAARAGWRFRVHASVADLARLAPLLPPDAPQPPPLHNVSVEAEIAEPASPDGPLPVAVSALTLRVGESDLGTFRPGLRLARLEVSAPALDQPVRIALEAAQGTTPIRVEGTLGPPVAFQRAGTPFPIDLALGAADAAATVKGAIADARAITGVDLALALRAPDLAALSPLAGRPLPPLRDLVFEGRLAERGARFAEGAVLRDLRLASSAGDAAGEAAYVVGAQRPGVTARLASRRVDLDALRAAAATAAPPSGAAPAPTPPPRGGPQRVIPDIALPFEALTRFDTDLHWTVAELVARGATWRDLAVTAAFAGGRGQIAPLAVTAPEGGGRIELALHADATRDPPAARLEAKAPGLDLAPLLAAFGQPPLVAGKLEVEADLHGTGRDSRALARTLDGRLGLASVGGSIDAGLFERLPAQLRQAILPQGPQGRVAVECLAIGLVAADGVLRTRAFLIETALGRIGGSGGVNLHDETVALRLLSDIRAGGIALRAPVTIGGTLADPRIGVDPAAAAAGGLEAFLSLQDTPDRTLQGLAGALGALGSGGRGGAEAAPADCAAQLAIARGGRAGPAPPARAAQPAQPRPGAPAAEAQQQQPAPAVPGVPRELQAPAQQLLRGLFRR